MTKNIFRHIATAVISVIILVVVCIVAYGKSQSVLATANISNVAWNVYCWFFIVGILLALCVSIVVEYVSKKYFPKLDLPINRQTVLDVCYVLSRYKLTEKENAIYRGYVIWKLRKERVSLEQFTESLKSTRQIKQRMILRTLGWYISASALFCGIPAIVIASFFGMSTAWVAVVVILAIIGYILSTIFKEDSK